MNKLPEEIEREIYHFKHQMEWFDVMEELARKIALYGEYRRELWERANDLNEPIDLVVRFPEPFIFFVLQYGMSVEYTLPYIDFLRYGFDDYDLTLEDLLGLGIVEMNPMVVA